MINYTQITELYGDQYNLSPRMQFSSVTANKTDHSALDGFKGSIMFMDTERENQIKLGKDWPYSTLNEGECLASSTFGSTYKVK